MHSTITSRRSAVNDVYYHSAIGRFTCICAAQKGVWGQVLSIVQQRRLSRGSGTKYPEVETVFFKYTFNFDVFLELVFREVKEFYRC